MHMGSNNVRQTEIHAAEPLISEVQIAVEKFARYKSEGTDKIPAQQEVICYSLMYKNLFIGNKEGLTE
jgi:hypothetical protein